MNVGNVVVFSNYFLDMLYLFVWRLPRINKSFIFIRGRFAQGRHQQRISEGRNYSMVYMVYILSVKTKLLFG